MTGKDIFGVIVLVLIGIVLVIAFLMIFGNRLFPDKGDYSNYEYGPWTVSIRRYGLGWAWANFEEWKALGMQPEGKGWAWTRKGAERKARRVKQNILGGRWYDAYEKQQQMDAERKAL